jgi:hypothetical protein
MGCKNGGRRDSMVVGVDLRTLGKDNNEDMKRDNTDVAAFECV